MHVRMHAATLVSTELVVSVVPSHNTEQAISLSEPLSKRALRDLNILYRPRITLHEPTL